MASESMIGTSSVKLVELPDITDWNTANKTHWSVFLPKDEHDSLKVSVDREPQAQYPLLQQSRPVIPVVIDRDPRFISLPRTLLRLEGPPREGSSSWESSRKRSSFEDKWEYEDDEYRQRKKKGDVRDICG